ncbi:MAG: 30S ribosomal protein S9 [Candidatus Aenigmarchaeota archaeon]|nr:30S ribosomal protein S9 [Candidatus Aenigmarchaeota archaeon]
MIERKIKPKTEKRKAVTDGKAPSKPVAKGRSVVIIVGKRKKAVARAVAQKGHGIIRINNILIKNIQPSYRRMRIMEPILLAGKTAEGIDIDINVRGGGIWGQADASRTAIANAILNISNDKKLHEDYIQYDRSLLISDARRTEPHKPSRSSAGPRRTKQQSKR